jgi:acyl carrier protein
VTDASTTSADPRLAEAFRRALDLGEDVDVTTLAYGAHPNWDSVGHMVLVAELEETYGVMLDTDDVIGLSDYAAAVELLARLGVAAGAPVPGGG